LLPSILVLVASALHTAAYSDDALLDQVVSLPGAEALTIPFNQFSGYLTIGDAQSKNMHYWMVESMGDPSVDPIAFWTNGGPGCSGLLGFMTEQGPFRANADMTLSLNANTWNKVATMVFIEQPCGVGFSYSDNKDDYKTNDTQAAIDNYDLIQAFFARFPEYRANDLHITSESYGGHYMPMLASKIVEKNAALSPDDETYLNFKGFAVGNPATTFYSAIPASLDTFWGHQLIAKPTWDAFTTECRDKILPNVSRCEILFEAMYFQISKNLNPYALDYPVCVEDSPAKYGRSQRNWLMRHMLGGMHASDSLKRAVGLEPDESYEPCAEDYMTTYLNQDVVKTAIHVNEDIDWKDCSYTLRYDQADGRDSMVPYYQNLLNSSDINILVYSGDDDSVCATIGTQSWIWDLGFEVSARTFWDPYVVSQQTAGYLTKWKDTKLAFLTVHGAGHEVPAYKPEVALDLFTKYLAGDFTDGK